MEYDADRIIVNGDIDTKLNDLSQLTAGSIELKGDYIDTFGHSWDFGSTGTFQFILAGEKDQTLKISDFLDNETTYHFANLVVNHSDTRKILLTGNLDVGELTCAGIAVQYSDGRP